MNIIKTNINIENVEPFTLIHMSDTHLCLADNRNDERKIELAERRTKSFPQAEKMIQDVNAFNRDTNYTIVHTGDLIDFVSFANLDAARAFTDQNDVFMAAGNHEFSLYVGEAFEDEAYRNQSLALVQDSFKNNIRFASRKINGINLIAIDNSYYRIDQEQLEQLKAELSLPMPAILFLHVPLYTPAMYNCMLCDHQSKDAALMNVPEEKMSSYSDYRYRQQKADKTTKQAYDLIVSSKNIKAIFTGHLHFDYEDKITETLTQYITGCTTSRIISFN